MGKKLEKIICPKCNRAAIETNTRYGIRAACCDLWSWDRKPLACAATHKARQLAHKTFDPLWKNGLLKRSFAYQLLANELQIPKPDCHMALMPKELAALVPAAVASIRDKLAKGEVA